MSIANAGEVTASPTTPKQGLRPRQFFGRVCRGAAAGFLATIPMTVLMDAAHRQLPWHERGALPPRDVALELARRVRMLPYLDESERRLLTLAAHLGYGASMGALYTAIAPRQLARKPLGGAAFGLAVWAGNYLGLLPALEILPPATDHPARRNAIMIGAHILWGTVLATLAPTTSQSLVDVSAKRTKSEGAIPMPTIRAAED